MPLAAGLFFALQTSMLGAWVLKLQGVSAELVTASARVRADTYVIAAGLGTPHLARKAGVEVFLADKPATLNVYTVPAPPLLQHMLLSGASCFFTAKA